MSRGIRRLLPFALCLVLFTAQAKPLPDLKFRDLAGTPQRFGSLHGTITVITFWATWCGPCREELPRLTELKRHYAGSNVRFLAVSIDESKDRAKIQPFLAQLKVDLDVWVGADTDTLGRVGLGDIVPGTLVVDKDGEVIGRIMGEARDADVTSRIDWLLHDRQGPAPEALVKRY